MVKLSPKKIFRTIMNLAYGWIPGGQFECVMCGHQVWKFTPYRGGSSIASMEALRFVSGDMANFGCPRCGCHDRERHLMLYLKASGIASHIANARVLHFAPESHLGAWIRSLGPSHYAACDLIPYSREVEKVDIEQIPYETEFFDFVIVNHVLEHVHDDLQALAEIFRVLRRGGYAILQTPFSEVLAHTWSDPGITHEYARLHAYGQEDHARLYGRDIFKRFASSGLLPRCTTHAQILADFDAHRFGVGKDEPFFLFQRPE